MQNEYSQLLLDIQKKSKITIKKVSDLKYLKEEIFSVTEKKISFNTLRRLYGFLPNTVPSQNTLKTLSNYLSYTNYANYLNNKEVYVEWFIYMKILKLQQKNHLSEFDLNLIKSSLKNDGNIIAIANYVGFLIQNKKIDLLHLIFSKINFDKLPDSVLTKFAIICSYSFLKLQKIEIIDLYKELIVYENFRNSIPLYYIDYTNLNGYYIVVLKLIKELNSNESDFLFCSLMEFYQLFYSNENYSTIEIRLPEKSELLFPVLLGRYYGYKILQSEKLDNKLKNIIVKELKISKPAFLLVEIFPALIIKEEFEFLNKIIEENYEQIFDEDRWSSKSTTAIYLIGLASINVNKGNLKAAQSNLDLVELDKIQLAYTDYTTLFYYLIKIQLHYLEKNLSQVTDNYTLLENLANKTGFTKFISLTQKYV